MNSGSSFIFSEKQSNSFWIGLLIILTIGFFLPRTLAFLPSLLGTTFFALAYFKNKILLKINKMELLLLGSLSCLAFLSALWADNTDFSIEKSFKLFSIILPSILLLSVGRQIKAPSSKTLYIGLTTLISILAAFLISQEMTEYHLMEIILDQDELKRSKLNRTYIVFAFLSLLTQWIIKNANIEKKNKLSLIVPTFLISTYSLSLAESQTAQLTYLCGLFFLFLWPIKSRKMGKVLFTGIMILCLTLPFVIKPVKNHISPDIFDKGILAHASIMHRFEVWEFTVNNIFKSPVYGHGIESQRFMKSDKWMEYQRADSILHAHNIILQIWIEFGIIGILLGIIFLIYFYKKIYEIEDLQKRNLYLTIFTATFCCAMTGYGVWQGWQVGFFMMMATTAIALSNKSTK